MNTYAITRGYLLAREKILMREISDYGNRAQDKRASSHTWREWTDLQAFSRAELDLVRQALAELPT